MFYFLFCFLGSKVTIPTLMLSIKAIDVVIRFLGAENAFKDDSQVMLKKIEVSGSF